jgi:hypothetical protein
MERNQAREHFFSHEAEVCVWQRTNRNYKNNKTFRAEFVEPTFLLFLCQRLYAATSSPADDVYHYVIPQKLLDSIFNKLSVFIR